MVRRAQIHSRSAATPPKSEATFPFTKNPPDLFGRDVVREVCVQVLGRRPDRDLGEPRAKESLLNRWVDLETDREHRLKRDTGNRPQHNGVEQSRVVPRQHDHLAQPQQENQPEEYCDQSKMDPRGTCPYEGHRRQRDKQTEDDDEWAICP